MLSYIEYLNTPTGIATVLVGVFLCIQIIGELLEFKGNIVPEFMKVRKYFSRKKIEREAISQLPAVMEELKKVPETLKKVQTLLGDVDAHYSKDNITKRDEWIQWVNNRSHIYDEYAPHISELEKKMDKNNAITQSLWIDSKRNMIIEFASKVIDEKYPATREQFNRIFKVYQEYEEFIHDNDLTNGEVDIAIRIIKESYEKHMRNHTFVEDVRGYNV